MIQPFSVPSAPPPEKRELVRQFQLTRLLLEEMGGSLPCEQIMTEQLATVLDVACGAGGWALDVAQTYPALHVTGVDSNGQYVAFAQRLADEGGLVNVRFLTQDMHALATTSFDPDCPVCFDLVNLALIACELLTTDFEQLVQSLLRLCRPGGLLRWTEMELPITTSPAFERLMALVCQALQRAGQTFLPPAFQESEAIIAAWRQERGLAVQPYERRQLGITPMMGSWLRRAGCTLVEVFPTAIEVSSGTRAHPCFGQQVEVFGQQIAPFLREQAVIVADELAQLLTQVQEEIQQQDFCGLCFVLTAYGYTAP
jgi:Methyltransferase domain